MRFAPIDWAGPTPEPTWQAALDRLAPRTDRGHDWLLLRWEAGDPWAPVHRWVVWQMTPESRIPDFGIIEALRGPNPRNFGYWDPRLGRFVRTRALPISRQQWEIFQEHRHWAQPLWIVQGRNGGHLKEWTDVQSTLSQMHGGPEEPPRAGALPYAPFDQRVVRQLRGLDVVARFGDILGRLSANPQAVEWLDLREREQTLEMARQLWGWLGEQIAEGLNPDTGDGLTRKQADEIWDHADPDAPVPDYEAEEERFLESVASNYSGV